MIRNTSPRAFIQRLRLPARAAGVAARLCLLILMGVVAQRNASSNPIDLKGFKLQQEGAQLTELFEGTPATLVFDITNPSDQNALTTSNWTVVFNPVSGDPWDKASATVDSSTCLSVPGFAKGKPGTCKVTITVNSDPPDDKEPKTENVDTALWNLVLSVNLTDRNGVGTLSDVTVDDQGHNVYPQVLVKDYAAPEPASLALAGTGILLIAAGRWRRRKRAP
jgi:hypothetical protein